MTDKTHQMNEWSGAFGREYTDRNPHDAQEMNRLYTEQFGLTRTELNEDFMGSLDRSLRILEVGANVGTQLQMLQSMGFKNLYGVELQWYAVEEAKKHSKGINLLQGSAFDLPFKDGYFDLIYTSGVLIHISPTDIGRAISEIRRCTRRYVWGFEYYAESYTEIPYRGQSNLLWKTNFAGEYMSWFPELHLVKERMVPYRSGGFVDQMYLLDLEG